MFNKQAWDTHWRLHKCWFTSPENVPSPNPNRTGCRTKCLLRAVSHYDRLPLQHAEHRVAAPVPVFCTTMQTFLRNKNSACTTTHHVMHIDIQSVHEGISLWKDLSVDWKSGASCWIQTEWVYYDYSDGVACQKQCTACLANLTGYSVVEHIILLLMLCNVSSCV